MNVDKILNDYPVINVAEELKDDGALLYLKTEKVIIF